MLPFAVEIANDVLGFDAEGAGLRAAEAARGSLRFIKALVRGVVRPGVTGPARWGERP
jgi:hypothetical protein